MKREQQRKLKELKKALPLIIKEKIKKYKFKKNAYMVWSEKNDLFYDMHIHIGVLGSDENILLCGTCERIKPMWLDDLLWDLLNMPSNKNEPKSLRAIGAFTVSGVVYYTQSYRIDNWSYEEVEACVEKCMEEFYKHIQMMTINVFYALSDNPSYHDELRRTLILIHDEKYQEAIASLDEDWKGGFCNNGIWINDAIRDYCSSKL